MSDFVYDNLPLNNAKQNRSNLPAGEDPNRWIQAAQDWNPAMNASLDLRGAILSNRFFGLQQQVSEPAPPVGGALDFLWLDNTGTLWAKINGVNNNLLAGGGGGVTTPAPNAVPKSYGTGLIDSGWIDDATPSVRGLVSTGTQTIGGAKTFQDDFTFTSANFTAINSSLFFWLEQDGIGTSEGNATLFLDNEAAATPGFPQYSPVLAFSGAATRDGTTQQFGGWFIQDQLLDRAVQIDTRLVFNVAVDFAFGAGTPPFAIGYTGATGAYLDIGPGTTADVSTAGRGRIRYNAGLSRFEQSSNGAAYAALGGSSSTLSQTYVAGSSAGDQTLLINPTDGGPVIYKSNAPGTGPLLQSQTSTGATIMSLSDNSALTFIAYSTGTDNYLFNIDSLANNDAWTFGNQNNTYNVMQMKFTTDTPPTFGVFGTDIRYGDNSTWVNLKSGIGFYMYNMGNGNSANSKALVVDTAIGGWTDPGSRLLLLRNGGADRFGIDGTGTMYGPGDFTIWNGTTQQAYVQLLSGGGAVMTAAANLILLSVGGIEAQSNEVDGGSTPVFVVTTNTEAWTTSPLVQYQTDGGSLRYEFRGNGEEYLYESTGSTAGGFRFNGTFLQFSNDGGSTWFNIAATTDISLQTAYDNGNGIDLDTPPVILSYDPDTAVKDGLVLSNPNSGNSANNSPALAFQSWNDGEGGTYQFYFNAYSRGFPGDDPGRLTLATSQDETTWSTVWEVDESGKQYWYGNIGVVTDNTIVVGDNTHNIADLHVYRIYGVQLLDSQVGGAQVSIPNGVYTSHIKGSTATPTFTAAAGLGTGPTVTVTGSDLGMTVALTVGTGSPTANDRLVTIHYNTAYGAKPRGFNFTPVNQAAVALQAGGASQVYLDYDDANTDANGYVISVTGSALNTTQGPYEYSVTVIE